MSPRQTQSVRVFVASPSDLAEERAIALATIRDLSDSYSAEWGVTLQPIMWEHHIAPFVGHGVVEDELIQRLNLVDSDVFVGMLWNRFGLPTGQNDPETGKEYQSGTEQEFQVALRAQRLMGKPEILFYRCERPGSPLSTLEACEQRKRVIAFFGEFYPSGRNPGIAAQYITPDEFRRDLSRHLLSFVVRACNIRPPPEGAQAAVNAPSAKVHSIFFPGNNATRNKAKRQALIVAQEIRLLAHSGHAYLAEDQEFHSILCERLRQGVRARVLIIDPWSYCGFMLALAGADNDTRRALLQAGSPKKELSQGIGRLIDGAYFHKIKVQAVRERVKEMARQRASLEVRITRFEVGATILLTDREAFCEPYLYNSPETRRQIEMDTFEVHAGSDSYLSGVLAEHFECLWGVAERHDGEVHDVVKHRKAMCDALAAEIRRLGGGVDDGSPRRPE